MMRLHHFFATVAVATLAVLSESTLAHADPPPGPLPASAPAVAVEEAAPTVASGAMGRVMTVLDVLGLVEKHAPKTTASEPAHARTPIWRSPEREAPTKPLLYSSLVVAKF